jgi:hypothetical protein
MGNSMWYKTPKYTHLYIVEVVVAWAGAARAGAVEVVVAEAAATEAGAVEAGAAGACVAEAG